MSAISAPQAPVPEDVVVERIHRSAWESLSAEFGDYNYQQAWAYGLAMAQRRGAMSEHVAVRASGRVIALADVRVKRLPFVGGGVAYISSGPLTRRGTADVGHALDVALSSLTAEYVCRRGLVLRILPPIGSDEWNRHAAASFAAAGFTPTGRVRGYRTLLLDITPAEASLRAALAQKWRNCLNASERQSLEVQFGTDQALFDQFITLLDKLVSRKGFDMDLDARFYAGMQQQLPAQDKLVLGLVTGGGELHAGGVFAMHGDSCVYLLGATAEAGLKSKASYLLHWSLLLQARQRGMRTYDLGGIDPVGNPGVYNFKRGFSGQDVAAAGPFERLPTGLSYGVTRAAESVYRLLHRQRSVPRPQAVVGV